MTKKKKAGQITYHGRQAIVTKYHGPTNTRGSQVSARAEAGRIFVEWDDALNSGDNHTAAARALLEKLGWLEFNDFVGGGLPGTTGTVFVAIPKAE